MASPNDSSPECRPYGAFNNLNADGANGSWSAHHFEENTSSKWLQIRCPEPVKIWKVTLKATAIDNNDIFEWNISASIDGGTYTTLLTSTTPLLGAAFEPSNTANQY